MKVFFVRHSRQRHQTYTGRMWPKCRSFCPELSLAFIPQYTRTTTPVAASAIQTFFLAFFLLLLKHLLELLFSKLSLTYVHQTFMKDESFLFFLSLSHCVLYKFEIIDEQQSLERVAERLTRDRKESVSKSIDGDHQTMLFESHFSGIILLGTMIYWIECQRLGRNIEYEQSQLCFPTKRQYHNNNIATTFSTNI